MQESLICKKMTKELLNRFLGDRCTSEELDELIQWIEKESYNEETRNLVFEDWKSFQMNESENRDEDLDVLLDKIHHKINISKNSCVLKQTDNSSFAVYLNWLTKIAAILLLPILSLLLYTLLERPIDTAIFANLRVDSLEVIAPIGSRTSVQLSDGSKVYLNYGSKIKYAQNFEGKTREVTLTGEGFFNVAHNPLKPFVVKTKKINVRALGTVFNVQAYPEDDNVETTLVEGKVLLEKAMSNHETQNIGTLVPGQHANYSKISEKIISTQGDITKYIAWINGKLVFKNDSLTQVADKLSRIFNVDFVIDKDAMDNTYTVTFVDEPLFQILDLITLATPVSYAALPREKLPDGTFSKQKIIIEKRKYFKTNSK